MINTPVRVLIVDDAVEVRESLQLLLTEEPDIQVIGQAANGEQAVQQAIRHRPDVILMDLVMPIMNGIEAMRCMREAALPVCVIALTSGADDPLLRDAVQAGAIGSLHKDVFKPDLLAAIYDAARGQPPMPANGIHKPAHPVQLIGPVEPDGSPDAPSPLHLSLTGRERDVLRLITQGFSNKQIAMELRLTEGTVKGYVSAILAKLRVADRTQAAVYALKNELAEG